MFHKGGIVLLGFVKEKSWSVRLVNGYVANNQIRSENCKGCESITKLVVGNNGNNDLVLYGCGGHKCKHTLIRMKFGSRNSQSMLAIASPAEIPQILVNA